MPYRPRELVVRAREAAAMLLAALDHNEMVPRFLDLYAAEHRRPSRADQPAHYRDQLETIRREAILAMVLHVKGLLPKRLKVRVAVPLPKSRKKSRKRKKTAQARTSKRMGWDFSIPLLDLFREEFFVALGQALRWNEEDAEEFWRDLDLYERLWRPQPNRRTHAARATASGPFVDRVALLLDPSLMEQARREAGKFQLVLDAAADRALRKVFSRRRPN